MVLLRRVADIDCHHVVGVGDLGSRTKMEHDLLASGSHGRPLMRHSMGKDG